VLSFELSECVRRNADEPSYADDGTKAASAYPAVDLFATGTIALSHLRYSGVGAEFL
jgi:hypothetical protein